MRGFSKETAYTARQVRQHLPRCFCGNFFCRGVFGAVPICAANCEPFVKYGKISAVLARNEMNKPCIFSKIC